MTAAAAPAWSLTDEEIFRDFRFNLINPGARARALGGAFVSLADDATAAQANPAGLGYLRRSEAFAELRMVDNEAQSSVVNGSLPSGGDSFFATGTDLEDGSSLSFLSAVLARRRWTVGFSRQELVDISNTTLSSFAFTFEDPPGAVLTEGRGAIDVEVVNLNAGVGFRVTDRLAIGATLAYSSLDVASDVTNTIVDTLGVLTDGREILEPTLDLRTTIDDDDDDLIYSLGLLYRRLGRWSVGAVYRRGPRFSVVEEITSASDADGDGEPDGADVFGVAERLGQRFVDRFSLPDVLAAGASWNVSDRLTVAADVEHIVYSNLLDGYVAGVNVLTSSDARFTIDDATDYRAGIEYLFLNRGNSLPPVALRAGGFTEESSTIRAEFTGSQSLVSERVFRDSGRQEHLTLGVGFVLPRYKIDLAVDIAEINRELLLSFIYQGK